MHRNKIDDISHFKLAQIWHLVKGTYLASRYAYLHNSVVNEILKDEFNINYKITIKPKSYEGSEVHFKDCTALHFLFYKAFDLDTFTTLLERGADFTIKNGNGQTALHLCITKSLKYDKVIPFINSVVSAHVKYQNSANPCNDNDISHFHGACIANHVQALELFLENGASIDDAVNKNSPLFAGYTPLHFAAKFRSLEVAQMLIERGANINAQTAIGWSPLDVLIGKKNENSYTKLQNPKEEQLIKLLLEKGGVSNTGLSSLQVAFTLQDLSVAERLLNGGADFECAVPVESPNCSGYTALRFAADNSIEAVKMLVTRGAKLGVASTRRSPLDICVDNYSFENVCDILSCSESWKTVRLWDGKIKLLDAVTAMGDVDQFRLFLQNKMKDITGVIPRDSPILPGYTILHLAVTFSKKVYDYTNYERHHGKTIVEECLNHGLSVNVQDVNGSTALHLAYIQRKIVIEGFLRERLDRLEKVSNLIDENNLSYLYIASAEGDESLVEKLLENGDPNFAYSGKSIDGKSAKPGPTPLHIASANKFNAIVDLLLRHGANVQASDKNSFTPIHWLPRMFSGDDHLTVNLLFDSLLSNLAEDRGVDGLGLTYLHIACLFRSVEVVEKLLDLGTNVNAVFTCDEDPENFIVGSTLERLRSYLNFTPLQMATRIMGNNDDVLDVLLRRGADVFAKGTNKWYVESLCLPTKNKNVVRRFFHILWERDDMQQSMEEKLGLTKLHVACYLKNEEAIRSMLNDEMNINIQLKAESEIFPGCTPLQLLLTVSHYAVQLDDNGPTHALESMIRLLLDHGADVTIANTKKRTAIHMLSKYDRYFTDADRCKNLLLNAQQDFSVNPTDVKGMSHFHLACLWHEVEAVEKFLQHSSLDINHTIDSFARRNAGCTPLHLSLTHEMTEAHNDWTKLLQIVDLLLEHGANVTAKDIHGNTPLHQSAVLRSPEMSILDKLVSYGGNIKSQNIRGQTPIEMWPEIHAGHNNPLDCIKIFQKYGYKINSWNYLTGEGYIAKVFTLNEGNLSESSEFEEFMKSTNVKAVDIFGRNAIHNSVALFNENYSGEINNYIHAIDSFIKIGIDIEHQDTSGQTALHYAARMENLPGIKALLAFGADVNIVDNNGKSAFTYAMEHSKNKDDLRSNTSITSVMKVIRLHIKKLQHLGIDVSQHNQDLVKKVQHFFDQPVFVAILREVNHLSQQFFSQIEMTKTLVIESNSLSLFDFFSETGALSLYCLLRKTERDLVDEFCDSIDYNQLMELTGVIKLQFNKMRRRLEMIDSALSSLRILLGFSVPGLCEQISEYLSNSDLMKLIESTALKTRKRKRSITICN